MTQAVLHGEQRLHTRRSGADHADAQPTRLRQRPLLQCLPVDQEVTDGLQGYHVTGGPGDLVCVGNRPGIDGQQIVSNRRAIAAQYLPCRRIDAYGLGAAQTGPCEAAQRPQIDVDVIEWVVPGDESRQHP